MSSQQQMQAEAPYWIIIDNLGRPRNKLSINGPFSISLDCRKKEKDRFTQHMYNLYPEAITEAPRERGEEFRNHIHRACEDLFNDPKSSQDIALWSEVTKTFEECQLQISLKQNFQGNVGEALEALVADQEEDDSFKAFDKNKPATKLYTVLVKNIQKFALVNPGPYRTPSELLPKARWLVRLKAYRDHHHTDMTVDTIEAFFELNDASEYGEKLMEGNHDFEIDPKNIHMGETLEHGQLEHQTVCEIAPEKWAEPSQLIVLAHTVVYMVR